MIQPSNDRTRIFISYRRDDARGASGRLYDWLRIAFGREQVFRDVASIGAGKWRLKIDQALAASAVCLPVIGLRWCDATNGPRLADEHDMVRHELVTALAHSEQGLTIILTLVEGAKVPKKADLPAELHDLLEWNPYPLSEEGWEDDVRRLIGAAAEYTGQAPAADVDTLITRVGEAETRMRAMEREKHLQTDQIRALSDTVAALTRQLAERPAEQRADLVTAIEALGRGDTLAAEAEFKRVLRERSTVAHTAAHEAAEAARHIASLALLSDIGKAVRYYRRACELESGHSNTWRLLGQACITAGDTSGARQALTRALEEAKRSGDSKDQIVALNNLGDLAWRTQRLDEALNHYQGSRTVVVQEAERNPENTEWQRDLSVSHSNIGGVLVEQGNLSGAQTAYHQSRTILETLARLDPENPWWQHDLSMSHIKIGDALVAQGDLPAAFAAFRTGLEIMEALVAHDPDNIQWQRDLSVNYERIGNLLLTSGDLPKALGFYQARLATSEALAARDPDNTDWLRDLSVSHIKIGDVLVAQKDLPAALAAFRRGLEIREALVARDPANIRWQRDLSVNHARVGSVLKAQGNMSAAWTAYRQSHAIFETLATRDPENTEWQQDLIVSYVELSAVTGDKSYVTKALDIAQAMQQRGTLAPRDAWMVDELKRLAGQ